MLPHKMYDLKCLSGSSGLCRAELEDERRKQRLVYQAGGWAFVNAYIHAPAMMMMRRCCVYCRPLIP